MLEAGQLIHVPCGAKPLKLVSQVFRVSGSEEEGVKKGIAGRLGARRSLVGLDAASPRPLLARAGCRDCLRLKA